MKKLLMASSSKHFLKRNTDLLTGRCLELFCTTSGEQALKLHEELPFDLVLSDVQLDEMDGITLCSRVNNIKEVRHIPLILCCLDHVGTHDKIRQNRAVTLLVKPIAPIQLLETISKLFDEKLGRSKRVAFKVRVLSKKLDLEFICHSYDISNTGILVKSKNTLNLGDQIICQFTIPGSSQIETEGEVIRSVIVSESKTYYGIKFINISAAHFKAIDKYVNSKSELLTSIKGRKH